MGNVIRLLLLCALVLGAQALAVNPAWATPEPPEWVVEGKDVTLGSPLEAQLQILEVESNVALLVQAALSHVEISCSSAHLIHIKMLPHGQLTQGQIQLLGCATYLNGSLASACSPHSPGESPGTITTEELTGQIALEGGDAVAELISVAEGEKGGSLFAVIELGSTCSIGEFTEVEGALTLEDAGGQAEVEATSHLVERGAGTSLTAFGHSAVLTGSASIRLVGNHLEMAFAANTGQTKSEPPEWMINKVNVTEAAKLEAAIEVSSVENNSAELLVQVGSIHVLIVCTSAQLSKAKTLPKGKLTQGFATFTGCATKLNGEAAPKCETHSEGDPVGTITSEEITGELKLVGGVPVTELTSVVEGEGSGSLFAVIVMGEKCSIGEFVEVEGSLTVKDCKGLGETETTTHLIEEDPGSSLVALGNSAKLLGSAILKLGGAHEGKTWSGLAG